MATRQRPVDLGTERGRSIRTRLGAEVRSARIDRGLTLAEVGRAVRLSGAEVSRIERGLLASASIHQLARLASVVGLELSARAYPGPHPIRDAAQARLLERFRGLLHPGLRWGTEVPLPGPGDQRAWDAMISVGSDWRYGVEAETSPHDSQALVRRLNLKVRDGSVDGVILVLPRTRRSREFVTAGAATLGPSFPVDGRRALERLAARLDPGGSSILLV